MIWKGLVVWSGSETPVVVVLSGSMETAIWRGDILFLWADKTVPYEVGEIIVYQIKGRSIPIIHRIVEVHRPALTDGDATPFNTALTDASVSDGKGPLTPEGETLPGTGPDEAVVSLSDNLGRVQLLTKGDNNPTEDRALYNPEGGSSKLWLEEDEVLGRAKGYLPKVGKLTIYLTDYPALKYILIAVLALFVLTAKE
jgi:signal peptidase